MSGFPGGASGKELACQCRRCKRRGFDPWVGKILLEKGMATHSSILAWRIPWTLEPVFSRIAACLVLHETLLPRAYVGEVILVVCMIAMELDLDKIFKRKNE